MIKNVTPPAEQGGGAEAVIDKWLFKDRESVEKRFGMEMERILELRKSKEGQRQLLKKMKEADPSLNGDAQRVLEHVDSNIEQLKKKESFLMKFLKLPLRAVQAVGRTVYKHPILSALTAIAVLLAILYFTPALAPTAGEYGTKLVESFKAVLGKVGVATPNIAVDATAAVPVTGDVVSESVAEKAAESFISQGEAMMQNAEAIRNANEAAGAASEAAVELSGAAKQILQSPESVKAVQEAVQASGIQDPLQRILNNLPPR